jgi:hypothetical protein
MPDTITFEVPTDAPDRDLRRVRQEVDVATKRAKIRRQYEDLLDEHPHQEAFQILAERHNTTARTVRRAVWGG